MGSAYDRAHCVGDRSPRTRRLRRRHLRRELRRRLRRLVRRRQRRRRHSGDDRSARRRRSGARTRCRHRPAPIPLAAAGVRVVGIGASPSMLRLLADKPGADAVTAVLADMAHLAGDLVPRRLPPPAVHGCVRSLQHLLQPRHPRRPTSLSGGRVHLSRQAASSSSRDSSHPRTA